MPDRCVGMDRAKDGVSMTMPAVLVIGSPRGTWLRDLLLDAGIRPVFRQTVLAALAALRRGRFGAVVVDHATATVDVLELVLNIRDIDESLRVLVIAGGGVDVNDLPDRRQMAVVRPAGLVRQVVAAMRLPERPSSRGKAEARGKGRSKAEASR